MFCAAMLSLACAEVVRNFAWLIGSVLWVDAQTYPVLTARSRLAGLLFRLLAIGGCFAGLIAIGSAVTVDPCTIAAFVLLLAIKIAVVNGCRLVEIGDLEAVEEWKDGTFATEVVVH